jgi:hypothetical protein
MGTSVQFSAGSKKKSEAAPPARDFSKWTLIVGRIAYSGKPGGHGLTPFTAAEVPRWRSALMNAFGITSEEVGTLTATYRAVNGPGVVQTKLRNFLDRKLASNNKK